MKLDRKGKIVPGGMGYRETHHALEMIAMSNKLFELFNFFNITHQNFF